MRTAIKVLVAMAFGLLPGTLVPQTSDAGVITADPTTLEVIPLVETASFVDPHAGVITVDPTTLEVNPLVETAPLVDVILRVLNFTCCPKDVAPNDIEVTYTGNIVTAGFSVMFQNKEFDTCKSSFPGADMINITCKDVIPNSAVVAISTTPSTSNFKSAFWSDANGKNIGAATPTQNVVVDTPEPGTLLLFAIGALGLLCFTRGLRFKEEA